jgi:hypothetical protein
VLSEQPRLTLQTASEEVIRKMAIHHIRLLSPEKIRLAIGFAVFCLRLFQSNGFLKIPDIIHPALTVKVDEISCRKAVLDFYFHIFAPSRGVGI